MGRMKTFLIYALIVIVVILLTDVIANICIESAYKDITQYEIKTEIPKIQIQEAKTTNANGIIKGNIKNNGDTFLQNLFIKIDLISNKGNILGTEYLQVGNMQPGEEKEFSLNYHYYNVYTFTISVTDEQLDPEIEYHPLIAHSGFYFGIAKFIVFIALPPFYILSSFI